LKLQGITLARDRKSLEVRVTGLREGFVHEIELTEIKSVDGNKLMHPVAAYTLNKIPKQPD
jgi:hypothetical protein